MIVFVYLFLFIYLLLFINFIVCAQVILVMSVSSKKKSSLFYENNIDKLRNKLYDIACHLQVSKLDGMTRKLLYCTVPCCTVLHCIVLY